MLPYNASDEGFLVPESWEIVESRWVGMSDANQIGDALGKSPESKRLAGFLSKAYGALVAFNHE